VPVAPRRLNSRIVEPLVARSLFNCTNETEPLRAGLYRNVTFNPSLFGGSFHAAMIR